MLSEEFIDLQLSKIDAHASLADRLAELREYCDSLPMLEAERKNINQRIVFLHLAAQRLVQIEMESLRSQQPQELGGNA